MLKMADALATCGSRLCIIFDPVEKRVLYPRFGIFDELSLDLAVGIKMKGGSPETLPFTKKYKAFKFVEQSITMNAIQYTAVSSKKGIKLTIRFSSPFYPGDIRITTAPFFFIDVTVEKLKKYRWDKIKEKRSVKGEFFLELSSNRIFVHPDSKAQVLSFKFKTNSAVYNPEITDDHIESRSFNQEDFIVPNKGSFRFGDNGYSIPFSLEPEKEQVEYPFIWGSFYNEEFFNIFDRNVPFKYTDYFSSKEELIRYARENKDHIMKRSEFFDDLFINNSLGSDYRNFIAFSFHSFLMNTWWLKWKEKEDWFSVWEGSCYYNSTMDVEYNLALVYFMLWPELLELILKKWEYFQQDGSQCPGEISEKGRSATISHDMGSGLRIGMQHYPHNMEIEENCNYLLLQFAYWRFTGKSTLIKKYYHIIKKVSDFIMLADKDSDGIPENGIANTIDDASPAIQYGLKQTYLGFKSYSALEKTAQMSEWNNDPDQALRINRFIRKTKKTLQDLAWLDDHYIVTLNKTTDGMVDAWTKEPLGKGELKGWDAYSIYTSNGLLYPFLVNSPVCLDPDRMRKDIINANRETSTEYGCTHTSGGDRNVWFSQNLWKDFTAAYLDVNILDNIQKYWSYQITVNTNEPVTCFYDTTLENNLIWYPRGITSIGIFPAICRFALDRVTNECLIDPLIDDLIIPLFPFADWKRMRIPGLRVEKQGNKIRIRISKKELLGKTRISSRKGDAEFIFE
ncbi:MAG: DUF4965 domain-containing protein [Spirochaetes bacterium]|nr:DUF4965 domain-containing protein [Spirochaetota bacterium]